MAVLYYNGDMMNNFVVVAVADNISKMNRQQIILLADLLADTKNASILSDQIGFAIQDKQLSEIEVQDPVCY